VLRLVVDDTQSFLTNGELPDSKCKTESLVSAGHSCMATLAEVEEFLSKHTNAGNSKRLIDTFKFVTRDIEGLQSKLEISAQLLQLSLTSFQRYAQALSSRYQLEAFIESSAYRHHCGSLSITQIKTNLKDIIKEYQSGARQPTVLSSVIQNRDYTEANDDELHDQLITDLEDKDVHPECIILHDDYIRKWLRDISVDGILDEVTQKSRDASPQELPELLSGRSTSLLPTAAARPFLADVRVATASQDSAGAAPLESPVTSSVDSLSSHPYESNGWSPLDQPNPEYVRNLLGTLLEADPFLPYEQAAALPKIQRAYQRLDYTHRGYLTRSEVLKALQDVLGYVGIVADKLDKLNLAVVISALDTHKDGQYDEPKFVSVMHNLAQLCYEVKREQLAQVFTQCGREAKAFLNEERSVQLATNWASLGKGGFLSQRYVPPFGWSRIHQDRYCDFTTT